MLGACRGEPAGLRIQASPRRLDVYRLLQRPLMAALGRTRPPGRPRVMRSKNSARAMPCRHGPRPCTYLCRHTGRHSAKDSRCSALPAWQVMAVAYHSSLPRCNNTSEHRQNGGRQGRQDGMSCRLQVAGWLVQVWLARCPHSPPAPTPNRAPTRGDDPPLQRTPPSHLAGGQGWGS